MPQLWGWRDTRTGERVSVTSTYSKEQAERVLARWKERDRQGGRPDLHEIWPFIEVYPLNPDVPDPGT